MMLMFYLTIELDLIYDLQLCSSAITCRGETIWNIFLSWRYKFKQYKKICTNLFETQLFSKVVAREKNWKGERCTIFSRKKNDKRENVIVSELWMRAYINLFCSQYWWDYEISDYKIPNWVMRVNKYFKLILHIHNTNWNLF